MLKSQLRIGILIPILYLYLLSPSFAMMDDDTQITNYNITTKIAATAQDAIPLIPFYFIRHGETDWNRERRVMGHKDIPLNSTGIVQAHQSVHYLKNLGINHVVSSPLLRAKETAEIISSSLKLPLEVDDGLSEIRWGEREGKIVEKEWTLEKWINGYTPQDAESSRVFQKRVVQALVRFLNTNKTSLIVAHTGVYWAIMDALGHPNCKAHNCIPYFFCPPDSSTYSWAISPLQDKET
jgi:broad specificity phosphatase PhoE